MKKLHYLLFLMGIVNLNGFAQTTDYHAYGQYPSVCEKTFMVVMNIGAQPETGGILSIDWGDGNTSTHNYTTTSGQTYYDVTINHSYSLAGSYQVSFNVYSGTAGADVDAGQDTLVSAPGASNCGYLDSYTIQSNPYTMYSMVPYKFTDANNNITFITPPTSQLFNLYSGLDPANAPYTVEIDPSWLATNNLVQSSPNIVISAFNLDGSTDSTNNVIYVTCNSAGTIPDFDINYGWTSNFIAALQSGSLTLRICNLTCGNTADASVSVEIPTGFIPNTTNLTNPVVTGNTLTFDIHSLADCHTTTIPFSFPGNTPAGTPVCFDVTVSHPNDAVPGNDTATFCTQILNSYDPNEKRVNQPTNVNPDEIEEFEYAIHFQNDGNYNALGVVLKDTISEHMDLSTFRYIGSKHPVNLSIDPATRVVTFTFNNINLGQSAVNLESSQGHVTYRISELPDLPVGTEIENTAYIYFDFNPPIVTNTTYNINELPLGLSDLKTASISLYPNPAKDKLQFSGGTVQSVSIYDLTGKLVLETSDIPANEIAITQIQTGIYQVVLRTENSVSTQKLVIQK